MDLLILNFLPEKGTFSMISPTLIIVLVTKLHIAKKGSNLIFVIIMMLTFY